MQAATVGWFSVKPASSLCQNVAHLAVPTSKVQTLFKIEKTASSLLPFMGAGATVTLVTFSLLFWQFQPQGHQLT